jgi:hypothetical protein
MAIIVVRGVGRAAAMRLVVGIAQTDGLLSNTMIE